MDYILDIYAKIFGRAAFRRLNYFFLKLGMKGLGFLNYKNFEISGEEFAIRILAKHFDIENIFDVGANHGKYSKILRNTFKESKIYCFEPHPINFSRLNEHISQLYNIYSYNIGFSDENKNAELFDYDNIEGSSHATLYQKVITDIIKCPTSSYQVEIQTLDTFLDNHQEIHSISFLKIDTEGNEYKVLEGAQNALSNDKIDIIQFEIGVTNIISKIHLKDFLDLLHNYTLYRILPKGLLKISYKMQFVDEIVAFQNIIAIRNDLCYKINF